MKLFARCYCLQEFLFLTDLALCSSLSTICLFDKCWIKAKYSNKMIKTCIHTTVVGWNGWERGLGYQLVYYRQHLYITQFHPFKSPVTLLSKCKEVRILNVLIYTFCHQAWLLGHIHSRSIKIDQIFNELLF